MNSKLPDFLRAQAKRGRVWGQNDCGLWLGDWLSLATGCPDVWAGIRGTYSNEAECEALYGPHAIVRQARRVFGHLPTTRDPLPGDIAVVIVASTEGRQATGVIRVHRGWMTLAPNGLNCVAQAKLMRAWRVEER